MQLDAIPPQQPQPTPDPNGKPGPHSPLPDSVPQPKPRKGLNDVPFPTHMTAELEWQASELFPGMFSYRPTVRIRSNAGYGYIHNHQPVIA